MSKAARLSAARLAAVQALYSMEITGISANQALDEFRKRGLETPETDQSLADADPELAALLVQGTAAERPAVDELVGGALSADWTVERLEAILRAILRVGAWELKVMIGTPARVVISEYVDLARAFYAGSEPNLVNAVMDRLARSLRPHEFGDGHGRQAG